MLARSKLNSIESKMSWALINNKIGHDNFRRIINKERNYGELNENIRIMKGERCDTEKNNLIEKGKRKVIDEIITQNV